MGDDPVTRAREAVKRVRLAEEQGSEAMAPLLADAFAQLAAGLERLAEAERNLVVQQAQLDDRLLRVEHNRAFAAIHWIVRAGSDLISRAKSVLPWRTAQNLGSLCRLCEVGHA